MIRQHFEHVFCCEFVILVGTFKDAVGESAFALVQAQDFLLDGVVADEMIDGDSLLLTDAIGAVCGLLLDGGIPPWVEMNDIVGCRQIQTYTACLEADEEDGALALLEVCHQLFSLSQRDVAVEIKEGYLRLS